MTMLCCKKCGEIFDSTRSGLVNARNRRTGSGITSNAGREMAHGTTKAIRQVVICVCVLALVTLWLIYKEKQANYINLWEKVNSLWWVYCQDMPSEECKPSLNLPCEVCK